jgi:Holliday junction resolvase RusA-like endonuclease
MVAAQAAIAGAAAPVIRPPFGPDYTGPVALDVVAVFEIPKTRRKGRHTLRAGDVHLQKPDASNLAKQAEDALNGVAYHDDAQVWSTACRKIWGDRNETVVTLAVPA